MVAVVARRLPKFVLPLFAALAVLVGPQVAGAATPPNPHDPCIRGGRDTCGTTGVGSYHTYAYGVRWFGDYRNVIAGVDGPAFCIDLNFWFPGRAYQYKQRPVTGLRTRAGAAISAAALSRISYAIWSYGRSDDATQQAAVMLYVHGQVRDAPSAEAAGDSIGKAVYADYKQVTVAAARYAGPYRVSIAMPTKQIAGQTVKASVKLVSASGNAVPNADFKLDVTGAASAPATVTANADGVATVALTPDDSHTGLSLKANATGVAANAPTLFAPTRGAAVANGQRLVTPTSTTVTGAQAARVSQITPTVTTAARPTDLNVGSPDADRVTISGLPSDYKQTVKVNVYGPAASQATITCKGTPTGTLSFPAANGTTTTPRFIPGQAGWYGYQVVLPGTSDVAATTSTCAPQSESFLATRSTPTVTTQASPTSVAFGGSDADLLTFGGIPSGVKPQATVNLYGPAASASTISCTGAPAQSVSATAANGAVTAPSVTPTQVGWYGYQVVLPATSATNGVTTACAGAEESFEVTVTPTVQTHVSAASAKRGASLSDTLTVSGLQGQPATVTAALYGPFTTPAVSCTGTPVWTGTVAVSSDGTYHTAATRLRTPGYYIYRESIAAQGFVQPAATSCADTAETTIVKGAPQITTRVSDATVTPGGTLRDHLTVSGLGVLSAQVHAVLWGPYNSAAAADCTGQRAWSGDFTVNGNGTYDTAPATIKQAGYYVYQESITGNGNYPSVATKCAGTAETSLANARPALGTHASASAVVPGGSVFDRITLSGVGATPVNIGVSLYGPFPSLSQLSCGGTPYWRGLVHAGGDGTVDSPPATIKDAGFYVYRETLERSDRVPSVTTPCATLAEAVLGRPQVVAGPGVATFRADRARLTVPSADAPARITIPALGIHAPVDRDEISVRTGQVEIPADIHRVGWWQDGAAPASRTGTTLLFGHIDLEGEGPGAFYMLALAGEGKRSVKGDLVRLQTGGGKLYSYRITGVSRMPKRRLPTSIFTKSGSRRLVMVTCGGPYDAKTHHFLDNVVVTAKPV